mgnify:CR=1 FL=1
MRLHRSRIVRLLFLVAGLVSLALGVAGIFLPVLPTTPFLLLSAYLFARSSHRFYHWLLNHSYLGPYIRQWMQDRSLTLRVRFLAVGLIATTISSSVVFFVGFPPARIAMALTGIAVSVYLLRFPTRELER